MHTHRWRKSTLLVATLFLVAGAAAFEHALATPCKQTCRSQYEHSFSLVRVDRNGAKLACTVAHATSKAECRTAQQDTTEVCKTTQEASALGCKANRDDGYLDCAGERACKKQVKQIYRQCKKNVKATGRECKRGARKTDKDCKKDGRDTKSACMGEAKAAFKAGKGTCKSELSACNVACLNPQPPELANCPLNEAGGPNLLTMTVLDGADLDAGWTGVGHNAGVVIGAKIYACLQDCDTDTNPVCTGTGFTGEGSMNKKTYGPPLPMLAANVATCIINEFTEDMTIREVNLQTGDIEMRIKLKSIVHLTGDKQNPCPVCTGQSVGDVGKCKGLTNAQGKTCTVEGTTRRFGNTSSDCLPFKADNAGELEIVLDPITSGTAELLALDGCTGGLCPCPGGGNQLKMNECDDPGSCSLEVCIANGGSDDVRNGIQPGVDQACCKKGREIIPCFIDDISRTGEAVPGQPLWPDLTYPKTAEGGKVAGVFCIPSTNSNIINQPTGLGGPGAFVLPGTATVEFVEKETKEGTALAIAGSPSSSRRW